MKSIFLITPGRSGTQWMKNILRKVLNLKLGVDKYNPNKVVFETLEEYVDLIQEKENKNPGNSLYVGHIGIDKLKSLDINKIVLVRDPRDICVSAVYYMIMKNSINKDKFEGHLKMFLRDGGPNANFIKSYLEYSDEIDHYLIRFEDLLNNTYLEMEKLLKYFDYGFDTKKLKEVLNTLTFVKLSGGREKGEEKLHHYRKGIIGDWKNYLTDEMNNEFCKRHKLLMEKWGYHA